MSHRICDEEKGYVSTDSKENDYVRAEEEDGHLLYVCIVFFIIFMLLEVLNMMTMRLVGSLRYALKHGYF